MPASFPSTRHRRLRQSSWIRQIVAETALAVDDLILPIFIREDSLPAAPLPYKPFYRYSLNELPKILEEALTSGISAIMLFPVIESAKKDQHGSEACNANGLLAQALRLIKQINLPIGLFVDVALDPYTSHGHDGVIINNKIDNDATVEHLTELALILADAGADALAPSDMMDGRVGAIRKALDHKGFSDRLIISYTAKYASSFYGPFRTVVGAHTLTGLIDKKTYQMDPRNAREALQEAIFDINEGADMLIVKPGLPYLDIISELSQKTATPILAYHVSGEYMMVKTAAEAGYIDEKNAFIESCIAFKRAGARSIITYAALDIVKWLNKS
ncbi:MAG: porphobilinogen synthase [Candidatus Paracaedibacteraceae bacterium]|nr:porphobilinogen synthase [Candidatus Paracaedibacteraceae bacterium]